MPEKLKQYPPVLTKKNFVYRFQQGEFGNRGPMWNTIEEFDKSNYRGLVHLRNRVAGGPTWYNVPHNEVFDKALQVTTMKQGGVKWSDLYFAAMAPTEKTLIQGEVMLCPSGLYLYYSTIKKPMRDALKERPEEVNGLVASIMLQHYMDVESWEWLNLLLQRYKDHVVEFSTYGVNWGTVPRRNTVIWEVRLY